MLILKSGNCWSMLWVAPHYEHLQKRVLIQLQCKRSHRLRLNLCLALGGSICIITPWFFGRCTAQRLRRAGQSGVQYRRILFGLFRLNRRYEFSEKLRTVTRSCQSCRLISGVRYERIECCRNLTTWKWGRILHGRWTLAIRTQLRCYHDWREEYYYLWRSAWLHCVQII